MVSLGRIKWPAELKIENLEMTSRPMVQFYNNFREKFLLCPYTKMLKWCLLAEQMATRAENKKNLNDICASGVN